MAGDFPWVPVAETSDSDLVIIAASTTPVDVRLSDGSVLCQARYYCSIGWVWFVPSDQSMLCIEPEFWRWACAQQNISQNPLQVSQS